jgi:hypothetical protein
MYDGRTRVDGMQGGMERATSRVYRMRHGMSHTLSGSNKAISHSGPKLLYRRQVQPFRIEVGPGILADVGVHVRAGLEPEGIAG